MSRTTHLLSDSWAWKQYVKDKDSDIALITDFHLDQGADLTSWKPCESIPSDIHVELLRAGLIPDPLVGSNEHAIQWIADAEWLYGCIFQIEHLAEVLDGSRRAELVFEGLDTICTVYLNGRVVLETDNMFLSHSIPLNPTSLSATNHNVLVLHFSSARHVAKNREAQYGAVRAGSCNLGDPSRVYIRKAQYHFRWDWGPELMSVGPWKPIKVNTYTKRIIELDTSAEVDVSRSQSRLSLHVSIDNTANSDSSLHITLRKKGAPVKEANLALNGEKNPLLCSLQWGFGPHEIALWWPVGYGSPDLYDLEINLRNNNGDVLDCVSRSVGFRDVQLIQIPLSNGSPGTSFYFKVNGVKMFIGGSNWIPGECSLPTMTEKKYRAWLELLKRGGQNCVRVWGGGIYEDDAFYDICDELGILVWQDFAFACGVYPAHPEFVASVRKEAECNVKRIRHHPSLAILCGNNEDYQQMLQWGVEGGLPAREIYEKVLPEVVEALTSPCIPYVYGSPYGGEGWDTSSPIVGDVHQWDVWAGSGCPYQDYDIMGGRFISEFGVPSLPCLRTVEKYFPEGDKTPVAQRHPQSKEVQQHTKAGSYERRFAILMNENFRMTGDLESYMYLTQLMQSEAIGSAYQVWRRQWKGDGCEETGGVIVWQMNDCWPVTSWAIVDYYLRPKPAFYAIARELRTITIGIQREVQKNRTNDRPRAFYEFGAFQSTGATLDIWATNSSLSAQTVSFRLTAFDLESDWRYEESRQLELAPNASTDIIVSMPCPHRYQDDPTPRLPTPSCSVVVAAFLHDSSGRFIAQHVNWPHPFKFIEPRDPEIHARLKEDELTISVKHPVKGLFLSAPGNEDDVSWSDNGFDVVPGYPYQIHVSGANGRQIHVAYLGREKAKPLTIEM
ncbi:glycoside hydrolase family 2 protein [Serendipita vermifera MAFF 305830]|uniref:Beta-mannosidase B n=1 Tax=Serendipita vermifera MAFF 305830 TaxID=933852 RepID=A0A0C3B697_SERVB|nr:glycoside hydrolase family 2 protein [Serendipita vermifera MAFF 305830]